jgi:hypothetical protein
MIISVVPILKYSTQQLCTLRHIAILHMAVPAGPTLLWLRMVLLSSTTAATTVAAPSSPFFSVPKACFHPPIATLLYSMLLLPSA